MASFPQYEYDVHGYLGKKYVFAFCFVAWDCISLGIHVCLHAPNIEFHIPFGFFRFGRRGTYAKYAKE